MATGIGETLRAARRRHERSLADAAAETRVRETYLAALEEEDFQALGGDVYVRGFLRSYARFLELDPEPLIRAYQEEYEDDDNGQLTPQPLAVAMPRERRSGPAVIVVAAGALLLVLAAIGLAVGGGDDELATRDRGPAPVATDPPEETPSPGEAETPSPPPEATPPPAPVEGVEVLVTVTGTIAWMRVQVDGETLLEGEQDGGFTRTFNGDEEVLLRIGDAAAVSVEANGADQGSLGSSGAVVVVTCADGETECDVEVVA